ncbi:TetR/AcrR family transcriptional regulator [Kitasatospora sp. NPDC006697]|uniref:TetR/AcrR family transcriptional regulator n=1 Tax=Kitasatospora sp. NPDC006697 TaxID=3364020 RepID=UPI003693BAFD
MTDRAAARGRPRSDQARQAVLAAALELVERDGYTAVTMKGIAEAAGVGRATVYRWWPSTGAVLMEALNELSLRVATPEPTADPEADLLAFLTATFALNNGGPARPVLLGLVADGQKDPEVAARVAELISWRRGLLRERLARLEGDWNVPLELVVDMLFGTMWYRMIDLHGPVDATTARELCTAVAKLAKPD